MDIDDILRAAETRDSDDHPHTIGEELLSQFKVGLNCYHKNFKFYSLASVGKNKHLAIAGRQAGLQGASVQSVPKILPAACFLWSMMLIPFLQTVG